MANTFRLRFTTNGQSSYKGKLCLEISQKGSSKRAYILVRDLKDPNYKQWDKANQQFNGRDGNTGYNNLMLQNLYEAVSNIASNAALELLSVQDVKTAYERGINVYAKKEISFGELVTIIAKQEREAHVGDNYQAYRNLQYKLYAFDAPKLHGTRIADIPVSEISNEHFIAFSNWLRDKHPEYGYKNLMNMFRASFNRAERYNIRTANRLTFRFSQHIPTKNNTQRKTAKQLERAYKNEIVTLSTDEIARLEKFDLAPIAPSQELFKQYMRVYVDAVLLMYYTLSRPCDIMRWKWDKNYNAKEKAIYYSAYKLRNKKHPPITRVGLSSKAIAIIEKYKGQSKGGYILPLPMNETDWDKLTDWKDNGKEYAHKWSVARNATIGAINKTLHKVQNTLNFDVPQLYMYVFRHSAITHAIRVHNIGVQDVADMAATSIEKIQKHYLGKSEKPLCSPLGA